MDVAQLSELVEELQYLLARISKYLKQNQYVYLRAFDSWQASYNSAAARLNADKTVTVPVFKLSPVDYSPTGKSIKPASVDKFVKTVSHQVARLQDKTDELQRAAERKLLAPLPLEKFFHRAADGSPFEPPAARHRVFVAIPAGVGELKLFWQGIQPALETRGLSFYRCDQVHLDDTMLAEVACELHSCRLAIFNLSGQAPNVMLTLGLAYGIGKPLIILQPQHQLPLGALHNQGYVRYAGADDLKEALGSLLPPLLAD
jgi:hypothetical protein